MPSVRPHLNISNLLGALLFVIVIGGALILAAGSSNIPSSGLLWAAILTALGIRIWVRWGWEDPFSIPACFLLAILALVSGFNLV